MYIFKCKGTWIYSGQYNLYLSSTLIKNSIFCCVAPGHWDSRKIKFCAMFSKSSLFKIEYSINIETQCLKNIQLYSKPHFHIFTRKKGPLPMLPESPPTPPSWWCYKRPGGGKICSVTSNNMPGWPNFLGWATKLITLAYITCSRRHGICHKLYADRI